MSVTRIAPDTTQKIAFSGTAAQSASIGSGGADGTITVRLRATEDCHVAFGSNPTATTSDLLLGAGETEYFEIAIGSKISAVRVGDSGDLYVTYGRGF